MSRRSLVYQSALVVVLIALNSPCASAQRDHAVVLGVTAGYDRPRGHVPDAWSFFGGFSLGVERHFGAKVSLRGSATLAAPNSKGDDVSVCDVAPPGSQDPCLPPPSYASEYALYSFAGLIRPSRAGPVAVIVGGGWAAFQKAGGPAPLPNSRAFWQWGGSLLLGRSHRAPRLEVSETRFTEPVGRVRRLVALQLWLRY